MAAVPCYRLDDAIVNFPIKMQNGLIGLWPLDLGRAIQNKLMALCEHVSFFHLLRHLLLGARDRKVNVPRIFRKYLCFLIAGIRHFGSYLY